LGITDATNNSFSFLDIDFLHVNPLKYFNIMRGRVALKQFQAVRMLWVNQINNAQQIKFF
jgi:hypothetical protein